MDQPLDRVKDVLCEEDPAMYMSIVNSISELIPCFQNKNCSHCIKDPKCIWCPKGGMSLKYIDKRKH